MKKSRIIITVILVVMVSALGFSQSATDVVKKAMDATGNVGIFKEVKTMSVKMTAKMAGRDIEMNLVSANPDKMHMQMNMMGMDTTMVVNGQKAWTTMMGKTMDIPMDKVENNRQMYQGFDGRYLLAIAESEAKYVGVKEFNGAQCEVLNAKDPSGEKDAEYYFDKASGLLAGIKLNTVNGDTAIGMSNYKEVQGVKIPHTMNINVDGNDVMVCNITEIKLNPSVDASLFERK